MAAQRLHLLIVHSSLASKKSALIRMGRRGEDFRARISSPWPPRAFGIATLAKPSQQKWLRSRTQLFIAVALTMAHIRITQGPLKCKVQGGEPRTIKLDLWGWVQASDFFKVHLAAAMVKGCLSAAQFEK